MSAPRYRYWVRNQLASKLKELMIAKKSGWQVLRNLKNQQLTGEQKQIAKAIEQANKAAAKATSFKKRSSSSTPSSSSSSSSSSYPSKRRSGSGFVKPDKQVVCFSCQQVGHIAPQCPNTRSSSAASSTPKPLKK